MPILLNNNPNKQAIMLGGQHVCKVMLGGEVVWQKHQPGTTFQDLTLESIEHQGVKLKASNQNGHLWFPMYFPLFQRTDWQWYLDRLTFLGDAEISLQSICTTLEADVINSDMLFPMFFFDQQLPQGYDARRKLTFIANLPFELALQSLCRRLVAEVNDNKDISFPMLFPEIPPANRQDYLNRLTFLTKDEDVGTDHIWTLHELQGIWWDITYGNGLFVIAGDSSVAISTNGINWTVHRAHWGRPQRIIYSDGLFCVLSFGWLYTSLDGITWKTLYPVDAVGWPNHLESTDSVAYGNNTLIAVGNGGSFVLSPDKNVYSIIPGIWRDIAYENDLFVVVGENNMLTTYDGSLWYRAGQQMSLGNLRGITYGNGLFVAVGDQYVVTSPDDATWTEQQAPQSSLHRITYGNGLFVAIGNQNVAITPDGATWIEQQASLSNLRGVTYGNGLFVAVGNNGIMTAPCSKLIS